MLDANFKVLSALAAYIKQLGILEKVDVADFINKSKTLAIKFIQNFENRFNPTQQLPIEKLKDEISNLQPEYQHLAFIIDNIISKVITRTNYFLHKPFISFKFNLSAFDKKLGALPKPVPYREIFVFSEEFEAIHLRNGKIARGGIRWSERKEDFRTEILNLVKTQNTKNSIIVPVGSKGGFVITHSTKGLSKEEYTNLGKSYYRSFLEGCLDITDNVINGKIIKPLNVVAYDEEDPYLVVAADKGTATFSDIANTISKEYNFWMGDAFASGGTNGYDHKKMGITAKGGWVCVQRHFRELGINTQTDTFTVVGIGDMSGDVFGNGLLRSDKIKLICAFNHMNIFIDPTPDPKISFNERRRLFSLLTSTWDDYDISKISSGGRIFKRSDTVCHLTPEIKECFNIKEDVLIPSDLIKAILKSKYDLLWNGGIGTYIKAKFEDNKAAGDSVNDILRINGKDLGAKVVGEGGNLGFTQKGRIEYALHGGLINTDAIDNSAGVDCSDHEVNIKILLNPLIVSNKITLEERNVLIEKMSSEIEDLVLKDNYFQSLALSMEQLKDEDALHCYKAFMDRMENNGLLDRKMEKLPSSEELSERYKLGRKITRPELSILMAYAKMEIYAKLIDSTILNDPYVLQFLISYFPLPLRENYLGEVKEHKLKNEICATTISNRFVNFAGLTFACEINRGQGNNIENILKAYLVAEKLIGLEGIISDIEALDYKVLASTQYRILFKIRNNILKPLVIKALETLNENTSITEAIAYFKKHFTLSLKNGFLTFKPL